MKHNNFIERKKRSKFNVEKIELNYFSMILFFCALVACMVGAQLVQQQRGDGLQQKLQAIQSVMPVQPSELRGVEWSLLLKKYTAHLPGFVRVKQVSLKSQDGEKMTVELLGTHVWDATRARQNLVSLKICNKVNLGKIERIEDRVKFELECLVL
jgi:hypothetical protein